MTRYFYTCPIKALYMTKYFGVVCELDESALSKKQNGDYLLLDKFLYVKKIYVAKESEHIFEPKEGDIGICGKLLIPVKFDIKDWVPSKMLKKETYYEIKETLFVKTVYRNGKHFFMPKEEN